MGHGFADWYERFYKTHPEYFALQPDGSRGGSEEKPKTAKICESNPAVWEQWIKDVEKTLEKNPHKTIFNAAANDSFATGHCVCEECRKWDDPSAEPKNWLYGKGGKIKGVALSDRQVHFANILGKKLKEKFPGKDYKVMILAYGYSAPPPIKEIPADNVVVALVLSFFSDPDATDYNSPKQVKYVDEFDGWVAKTKNIVWRPNTGDLAHWRSGGPLSISDIGKTLKKVSEKGLIGITVDRVPTSWWATQGPQYYLMSQLVWNPDRTVDEIMDDYYKSGFGPAAEDIKKYWTMLEGNRNEIIKNKKDWMDVFNSEFFKNAGAILDQATVKAKGQEEYLTRIAFVKAGLDYLRLNTENQALVRQKLALKTEDPAIKLKMTENWKQIVDILQKHPLALEASEINKAGTNGELGYIHPDADHKAIEEKRIRKGDLNKKAINSALELDPEFGYDRF